MQLGKNLKIARQNSGYTQEEVSNILFVSQQTISNWEKEISTPSVSDLVKISNLYQVSVDLRSIVVHICSAFQNCILFMAINWRLFMAK